MITHIINHLGHYVSSLDWAYICTFIIIAYGFNYSGVKLFLEQLTGIKIKTRYRVLIVGLLYAIALYFIRGYNFHNVESLLQSFIFSIVFHKLILEGIEKYIGRKLNLINQD